MYVRANMVTVDRDRIDDLVRFVQDEVLPVSRKQAGARGLAMAVDRENDRCTIVSFWDDMDGVRASEPNVKGLREVAGERFGATFDVRVQEVAEQRINENPQPGCWNRVSMLDVPAGDIDPAIETFRISTLPALEAIPGFVSGLLAIDREDGRAVAVTTWRDQDALRASEARADALREEVRDKAHGTITAVLRMEIVLWERMS